MKSRTLCGTILAAVAIAAGTVTAASASEVRINVIGEKSRDEIVAFFADNVFGRRPAEAEKPPLLKFEKISDDKLMPDGKMVRKQTRIVYGGSFGTNSFPVTAFVPADAKGPVPAFLLICNRPYGENCDPERRKKSDFFPVEEIVKRGFAAVSFYNWDIAPDYNTGNTKGVFEAFEKPGPYRNPKLWGTISAWAWGASRALDWLETVHEVDAAKVVVVGHSRGGKTALWTTVSDTRFAGACVNCSGCAGAKLNHLDLPESEHVAQIVRRFQYWFCLDYTLWANREREMPFDQHELLSCVAPRLLAVGSGTEDHWAGPEGERKATELASAAWEDKSCVSYHCHNGNHDLVRDDWNVYLAHAERHWKETLRGPSMYCVKGKSEKFCAEVNAGDLLPAADGRAKAVAWWKKNNITKLWLESYRHGERVASERLVELRDAFRADGFEVCGMITPTSLNDIAPGKKEPQMVVCWSDPKARERMREECARAARIFDTVILDDFLFSSCGDGCAKCRADKAARQIADWGEYKRTLMYEVCERDILPAAKSANPKTHFIIKYPCWYNSYAKNGYSPARQAELFGECWIGTETRDANPEPLQACWIAAWMDSITHGRCGGGWYDALDCTPEKFIEQARYTILGGMKESLVHCYDYLHSDDPGRTPFGEKAKNPRACAEAFEREIGNLVALAERVRGAERGKFELMPCGVSCHKFRKDGKAFAIYLNTRGETVSVPESNLTLAPHELRIYGDGIPHA